MMVLLRSPEAAFCFAENSECDPDCDNLLGIVKDLSVRTNYISKLEGDIDSLWLQLRYLQKSEPSAEPLMSSEFGASPKPTQSSGQQSLIEDSYEKNDELENVKIIVEQVKDSLDVIESDVNKKADKDEVDEQFKENKEKVLQMRTQIEDIEKSLSEISVSLEKLNNVTEDIKNEMDKMKNNRRKRDVSFDEQKVFLQPVKTEQHRYFGVTTQHRKDAEKMEQMEKRVLELETRLQELLKSGL